MQRHNHSAFEDVIEKKYDDLFGDRHIFQNN
jgi:hypothetical protein